MAEEKILVIDDDPGTCRTLNHILKEKGYVPVTVNTGQDGIEAGKCNAFDVALIDLMLPDMPGLDVLEKIKDSSPFTEAVVITGHASLDTAVQAMQDAAYSYVTKPIDIDYLLATIRKALEKERLELERKQAEEALRESELELRVRDQLSRVFLTVPDEDMYSEVLKVILDIMESDYGTFGYFREDGSFVVPAITRSIYWQKCNVPDKEIIFKRGTFGGIWGRSIQERKTLYSNEGPFNTPKGHIPIKNTMVTPVIFRDEVISAIHIANKPGGYTQKEQEMLETIANHIAPVLYARLQRDKQDKERKLAEEALKQSEEKFSKAFQSNPALIVISTLKSNRFIEVNNAFLQILGFERDEVIGKTAAELGIFADAGQREVLRKAIRDEGFARNLEATVRTKNGDLRFGLISADIIRLQNHRCLITVMNDITERKRAEQRQKLAIQVLEIANQPGKRTDIIRDLLTLIKGFVGVEAAAFRLKEGEDFPYYISQGFPEQFIEAERYLCAKNRAGDLLRNPNGNPILECMCGNIISGITDPSKSFFTEGGSFWTNSTTDLLTSTTEVDRKARTRNRCNAEGYESVALIPLRSGSEIIGLLQLNDKLIDKFNLELISFLEGIGASIGITFARKRAEEALEESEAKYKGIFESAPTAMVLIDSKGTITDINPNHISQLGGDKATRDDYVGIKITEHPSVINAGLEDMYNRVLAGESFDEKDVYYPSVTRGTEGYFNVKGVPFKKNSDATGAIIIHEDITERRQAEEVLKKSEERFRAMIENASDGITVIDKNGALTYNSPANERITGRRPERDLQQTMADYTHPDDIKTVANDFTKLISTPGETLRATYRILHTDGTWRVIETVSKNLLKNPSINGIVVNFRDISERKQAEEQLRASLEEKEVLLKEIHHRVKNNLQVISSMLYLQSQNIRDKRIRESLKESQDRVRSMALVHEQLYESKNLAQIDFSRYIENVTDYLLQSYGIDKSLISLRIDTGNYLLGVDTAITCGLIISELVSNSLKHAFPSGKANFIHKGDILIALRPQEDNRLALVVGDNGIGLPKKIDFRNTDSLGLRLVHMLIRQLGGAVSIDRRNGTTFKITFERP